MDEYGYYTMKLFSLNSKFAITLNDLHRLRDKTSASSDSLLLFTRIQNLTWDARLNKPKKGDNRAIVVFNYKNHSSYFLRNLSKSVEDRHKMTDVSFNYSYQMESEEKCILGG
jgi:hypothetical protein